MDKETYTDKEIVEFTWFKKQELIQKDTVTCAAILTTKSGHSSQMSYVIQATPLEKLKTTSTK